MLGLMLTLKTIPEASAAAAVIFRIKEREIRTRGLVNTRTVGLRSPKARNVVEKGDFPDKFLGPDRDCECQGLLSHRSGRRVNVDALSRHVFAMRCPHYTNHYCHSAGIFPLLMSRYDVSAFLHLS